MNDPIRVIDAHVHIFPPALIDRRDALLASDSWFGEAFGHPKAKMYTLESLMASMDNADVDVSVAVGWPWQSNDICHEHNQWLAEVSAASAERIAWLGIVNPAAEGAEEVIEWCAAHGARGFGEINADGQGFNWSDTQRLKPALDAIQRTGVPIMCHTSEPVGHLYPGKGSATPNEILRAIEAFPDIAWVLAHWGGGLPFYELMPEVALACVNVAYDSAATSYLYRPEVFRHIISIAGPEKVLFGSDWPVLGQKTLLRRVHDLGLDRGELELVLSGNAARIYGL